MFEQNFEAMLRGQKDAIEDRKRFTAIARDLFPREAKNLNLLLTSYNMGIAQDIQTASVLNNTFAFRYVKQLMEDYGISRANADWIVSVWCVIYGQRILGRTCEISLPEKEKGPAIQEEKSSAFGGTYADLFIYEKSQRGENALAAAGFRGDKSQTIIFQNKMGKLPVVEIAMKGFSYSNIEVAILTDGIKYIGSRAFSHCSRLHQVALPVSIVEIEDAAFAYCSSLKSIALPMYLKIIGYAAFKESGLKKLDLPESLIWIGDDALAGCHALEHIKIPENLERISCRLFEDCTSLRKVELPEKLNEIGERAFWGCSSLDFIVIPDSVQKIGEDAFRKTNERFLVQCSFGSFAEEYCRKNKVKYQLV